MLPVKPVAFFRTHKTASTTVVGLLARIAARNRMRVFHDSTLNTLTSSVISRSLKTKMQDRSKEEEAHDMCFWHIDADWIHSHGLNKVMKFYHSIMHRPFKFKIVREPLQHFVSWYYYFVFPASAVELEDVDEATWGHIANPVAHELGIGRSASISHSVFDAFDLVCVFDQLDECLVLLRRKLNLPFIDSTYLPLRRPGGEREDGKPGVVPPTINEIPGEIVAKIQRATTLDAELYKLAAERFQSDLASEDPVDFGMDLKIHHVLQQ